MSWALRSLRGQTNLSTLADTKVSWIFDRGTSAAEMLVMSAQIRLITPHCRRLWTLEKLRYRKRARDEFIWVPPSCKCPNIGNHPFEAVPHPRVSEHSELSKKTSVLHRFTWRFSWGSSSAEMLVMSAHIYFITPHRPVDVCASSLSHDDGHPATLSARKIMQFTCSFA